MKRLFLVVLLIIAGILVFQGCSENDTGPTAPSPTDTLSVTITQPTEGDTIIGALTIRAEVGSTPDYVEFNFDTFATVVDSTSPYQASYNVSLYPSGNYSLSVVARWGGTIRTDESSFYIEHIECNPDIPVVLNGVTIPEGRITRNEAGCVISLLLGNMSIYNPTCLAGIETYSATLETLDLTLNQLTVIDLSPLSSCTNLLQLTLANNKLTSIDLSPLSSCINLEELCLGDYLSPPWNPTEYNRITSIDLSPLSSCTNLERLSFYANQISNIDISPLSPCTNLEELCLSYNWLANIDLSPLSFCTNLTGLYLDGNWLTSIDLSPLWELHTLIRFYLRDNDLDASSCAQVCDFIDEHPSCYVSTDCDCGR